ncbi:MAG: tRNA pseudouridine synthase A [Elusimicrobia bacterium]|nr:tRNA pseudouridine synthase A [Elusimicrobiota bacterium]
MLNNRPLNTLAIIQYDGTDYFGWQIQKDYPTVQGEILRALRKIYSKNIEIKYTSRTDRGVHAAGQIITFLPPFEIPAPRLIKALNSILNDDIAVLQIKKVSADFDPRYDVDSKLYVYRYYMGGLPPYMLRRYVWQIKRESNISMMRKGLALLKGEKEFKLLSSNNEGRKTNIEIISTRMQKSENILEVRIRAPFFRTYMMRHIAGNLAALGSGSLSLKKFSLMLEGIGTPSPFLAPARGLELKKIYFK